MRAALADTGFDLLAALVADDVGGEVETGDTTAEDAEPTAFDVFAADEMTAARRLAAADARDCGVDVVEPNPAILLAEPTDVAAAADPRTGDLSALPQQQLAAVIARSYGQDELDELLSQFAVNSASELAIRLADAPADDIEARVALADLARRVTVDGPGDDAGLDALYEECSESGAVACDLLMSLAPLGSDYAFFGSTCGDRRAESSMSCGEEEVRRIDE